MSRIPRSWARRRGACWLFWVLCAAAACGILPIVSGQARGRNAMDVAPVAERVQTSLSSLVSATMLTDFKEAAVGGGRLRGKIAELSEGAGTAAEELNLPAISAAVASKAQELLAPLFEQMDAIGADFETLVQNSQDSEGRKPAAECGAWGSEDQRGWIGRRSSFAYPDGAQRFGMRPVSEFCSFFPPVQDYLASMSDVPAVHTAAYATPLGEYFVYNLRDEAHVQISPQLDAREMDWYLQSSTLRSETVIVVSRPVSLSYFLGAQPAGELVEAALNASLALLASDHYFQVIVNGYTSSCMPSQYLVLATEANKMKARVLLREQLRQTAAATVSMAASSRLAWKLFHDSSRDGLSANCWRSVVFITDGLMSEAQEKEALQAVAQLQEAEEPKAQVFALSIGREACSFCDSVVCRNQGVHVRLPELDSPQFYRSKLQALVATQAGFLKRGGMLAGPPIYDTRSGDYEMVVSRPIVSLDPAGVVSLHGVLALSVDLNHVIRQLRLLNQTESPHYYTAVVYAKERPGLLMHHPLVHQFIAANSVPPRLTLRSAEGQQSSVSGTAVNHSAVFDLIESPDLNPGCRAVALDRRMARRIRGSSPAVYEQLFSGASVIGNVTMCWSPVQGTNFKVVLVMEGNTQGIAPTANIGAASLRYPLSRPPPTAGVPDVYHRLDLDNPLPPGLGDSEYRDYFALHLAPRAMVNPRQFTTQVESAAQAKAVNTLLGAGPGGSRLPVPDAELGGDAKLRADLPGGGLSKLSLRDVQIARHLAALWNVSAWGSADASAEWSKGVVHAGIGMESGVWYSWPARVVPGQGSDVQDNLWYARAVQAPGELVLSRVHPCPSQACVGRESFLAPYQITLSLAFTDMPSNTTEPSGSTVTAKAPILGVIMVSFMASFFETRLFQELSSFCGHETTCFLMDSAAFIVAHPRLAQTDSGIAETSKAKGNKPDAGSLPFSSTNAGAFVGDVHGSVAQAMLSMGLLVQRRTKGATATTGGMVYEINQTMLVDAGGQVNGLVTHPSLADFVVRKISGSNVAFVAIRSGSSGEAQSWTQSWTQHRKDYCGVFSDTCADLLAPWAPDLDENAPLEELANQCTQLPLSNDGAARSCPVTADHMRINIWGSNASNAIGKGLRFLREASKEEVCRSWLEVNLPFLVVLCVGGVVGLAVGVWLHVQATSRAKSQLQATREFRDELHQPVKEIEACAELLGFECQAVMGAARSFYDFEYLIDVLERETVNLLVRQNRCQLRHQSIELQAIKDLLRVLKADMHAIHLRTSRLEAAAAEFEEADNFFPQLEVRAHQLRAKLDQLVKRDNEDTDYTLTNTIDFYASHHPDIFGADITEADTSAVNTPRSTLMGGKLADDSISNAQHHTARSNATRSVRMLAPREMPVHAGSHARRLRERGYSEQNGKSYSAPQPAMQDLVQKDLEAEDSLRAGARAEEENEEGVKNKGGVTREAEAAAAAVQTPRLRYSAAGATEHRVQHFMKLAAERKRNLALTHGPARVGMGSSRGGLQPLQERQDETDLDLTDDDTYVQRNADRMRLGPTFSERGRVLHKLDVHGHVADPVTETMDMTESRWDDTAMDLLSTHVDDRTYMDDATAIGPGSMIEEGDETRADSVDGDHYVGQNHMGDDNLRAHTTGDVESVGSNQEEQASDVGSEREDPDEDSASSETRTGRPAEESSHDEGGSSAEQVDDSDDASIIDSVKEDELEEDEAATDDQDEDHTRGSQSEDEVTDRIEREFTKAGV